MKRYILAAICVWILILGFPTKMISPSSTASAQSERTTPYEYLLMSKLAYEPDNFDIREILRGYNWYELARSEALGADDAAGYFGIAYRNVATDEVVIAHRGTNQFFQQFSSFPTAGLDLSDDLWNDIALFYADEPPQVAKAEAFGDQVCGHLIEAHLKSSMDGCKGRITHTGHSLGAFLAEVSAFHHHTRAVTFDSPGSGYVILADGNPGEVDITTYVGPPNIVNTANPHVGTIILVDPHWRDLRDAYFVRGEDNRLEYLQYSFEAHSIDRMIQQMNTGINVTGCWIVGGDAGFANFLQPDSRFEACLAEGNDRNWYDLSGADTDTFPAQFQPGQLVLLYQEGVSEIRLFDVAGSDGGGYVTVPSGMPASVRATPPEFDGNHLWYEVDTFPDLVRGWVVSSQIMALVAYNPEQFDAFCPGAGGLHFMDYQRFVVPYGDGPSTVWSEPNSEPTVGYINEGEAGYVTDGPICKAGRRGNLLSWEVVSDSGLVGWVSEGYKDSPVPWIVPIPDVFLTGPE